MAADETALGALHTKVAEILTEALIPQEMPSYTDEETGEVVPGGKIMPSAAIIQAATKFLKDNNITCVPSKDNALGALEDKMKERAAAREARRADLKDATEDMKFMGGLN